jgi:hypothetical protein
MLATDRNTRWMFILEIAIVLLFIIDVGILLKTMAECGLKPRPTRILMKTTSVPEKFATLTLTADVLIPADAKPVLSADGKIAGFKLPSGGTIKPLLALEHEQPEGTFKVLHTEDECRTLGCEIMDYKDIAFTQPQNINA